MSGSKIISEGIDKSAFVSVGYDIKDEK